GRDGHEPTHPHVRQLADGVERLGHRVGPDATLAGLPPDAQLQGCFCAPPPASAPAPPLLASPATFTCRSASTTCPRAPARRSSSRASSRRSSEWITSKRSTASPG